jgi:hypothetical protein
MSDLLETALNPRTVAIIGASENIHKIGVRRDFSIIFLSHFVAFITHSVTNFRKIFFQIFRISTLAPKHCKGCIKVVCRFFRRIQIRLFEFLEPFL